MTRGSAKGAAVRPGPFAFVLCAILATPALPATVNVAPTQTQAGQTVTVSWAGITPPDPRDWVGLYALGAPDGAFLQWLYVGSCAKTAGAAAATGSCPLQIPGTLAPGSYEVRLFGHNSYVLLASSPALTLGVSLVVAPDTIAPGDDVLLSWSGIVGARARDWIGVYQVGTPNAVFLDWFYVSCAKQAGAPRPAGSCEYAPPVTWDLAAYEFRLFANNGYTHLATSNPLALVDPPAPGIVFDHASAAGPLIPDESNSYTVEYVHAVGGGGQAALVVFTAGAWGCEPTFVTANDASKMRV